MSDYLTTLVMLKDLRRAAGMNPKEIEAITTARNVRDPRATVITIARIRELENLPRHEPTYAEARDLSRILLTGGITPLITPASLQAMVGVFGEPEPSDLGNFRLSDSVPLRIACRIAATLGLDDPIELEHMALTSQLWETLASGERSGRVGTCPWCGGNTTCHEGRYVAAEPHLPSCLPNALWSPQINAPAFFTGTFPKLMRPRTRGDSRMAINLKVLRVTKGITQTKLANDAGLHPNYMSRIERCEKPITQQKADRVAQLLGVPVERLFV